VEIDKFFVRKAAHDRRDQALTRRTSRGYPVSQPLEEERIVRGHRLVANGLQ
jgi:hypothetical protein